MLPPWPPAPKQFHKFLEWETLALFADPRAQPGFYLAQVPRLNSFSKGHQVQQRSLRVIGVMFGREADCVESDQSPVGNKISPNGTAIVEVVGRDVSQVSQYRR